MFLLTKGGNFMSNAKDLTKGNTFLTLLKFAIPLIVAGVISQSYNLVDLIIAGKVIGSEALGATGATTTLIQFLSSLFWGFGVAVSAVVGKHFGAKRYERIPTTIKTITFAVTVTMFFICLGCIIFTDGIMEIFKVDTLVVDDASSYFRIYMISLFIQSITYVWTCILQALGNSKYPMAMTLVSGLGNLGLNLLFVVVFSLGVNGLALASILSCLISLVMGAIKIIQSIKDFGGNLAFEFSLKELKYTSKLAIPCILQQCSLYLSSVIVQPLINGMGKAVSGGFSIAMNFNTLVNAVYHSISRAVASYASQSKGAKKYDNYSKGIYVGIVQQVILSLPILILAYIFPNQIFSIFMKDNDVSCLPYATQYVKLCVPFVLICAYGNLMHSFYKSVGAVKTVLFTTTLFTISRILFSYLLPNEELISNIYLGLSLSWVVEGLALLIAYYSGIWKTKNHKKYEKEKRDEKMV